MHNTPIGIAWIFGVFTLIQGMNIFLYAQHGGTTMD